MFIFVLEVEGHPTGFAYHDQPTADEWVEGDARRSYTAVEVLDVSANCEDEDDEDYVDDSELGLGPCSRFGFGIEFP